MSTGQPAEITRNRPSAIDALPGLRTLVDRGFKLWGHLRRPSHQRWVPLDERMIVLAIDDWAAIRDVVL